MLLRQQAVCLAGIALFIGQSISTLPIIMAVCLATVRLQHRDKQIGMMLVA